MQYLLAGRQRLVVPRSGMCASFKTLAQCRFSVGTVSCLLQKILPCRITRVPGSCVPRPQSWR
jgi:hypothetical protein